ncbi:YeaH/YhbH family protein [Paraglaciecola sp. L1A13]|uniref:YeaH/YhbH family protein n=1 Tax=Paraglaciecola sp. L1A13 TaxID=2686359 RepID=UPI00131B658D|nr:YeaH/YhbH family protein [Paraglaciecola sp. L1A13]
MAHFIDRRLNGKGKSTVNRQRFLRRYKEQIKKAVADSINKRSVTDINSGEKIGISSRDISEPIFHTGKGGTRGIVHPGNDQFNAGDQIKRPQGENGQGNGSDASNSGEGQDDFIFQISKDEYLDLLFEDLVLPNLQKNQQAHFVQYESHRAGFVSDGVPSNLDVVRSLKGSVARRIALTAGKKRELRVLELQLTELSAEKVPDQLRIMQLEKDIEALKKSIARVPFIDTFDLRFRNYQKRPIPSSKAVMFCLMDVSGSMDQATKDMAKRFYILLYLFLTRTYKNVEVVYIHHHTQAKEVDEQEFFYSTETGGTIVSSALKLMQDIIAERFDSHEWNIYAAQASDGDNWTEDCQICTRLLEQSLLPMLRYFAYIEITDRQHQKLWHEYQKLCETHLNFAIKHITNVADIYPVFRELFDQSVEKPKGVS